MCLAWSKQLENEDVEISSFLFLLLFFFFISVSTFISVNFIKRESLQFVPSSQQGAFDLYLNVNCLPFVPNSQ
jgi:hypothetical protein